jgi:hypothetical protein
VEVTGPKRQALVEGVGDGDGRLVANFSECADHVGDAGQLEGLG